MLAVPKHTTGSPVFRPLGFGKSLALDVLRAPVRQRPYTCMITQHFCIHCSLLVHHAGHLARLLGYVDTQKLLACQDPSPGFVCAEAGSDKGRHELLLSNLSLFWCRLYRSRLTGEIHKRNPRCTPAKGSSPKHICMFMTC